MLEPELLPLASFWLLYPFTVMQGREANLYCDNGFNSVEQVNAAIKEYNAAIDEIATKALNAP